MGDSDLELSFSELRQSDDDESLESFERENDEMIDMSVHYHAFVHDEDSPFRRAFPDVQIVEEREDEVCLGELLLHHHLVDPSTVIPTKARKTKAKAQAAPLTGAVAPPSLKSTYKALLTQYTDSCILIPVPAEEWCNRAYLLRENQDLTDSLGAKVDFRVMYKDRVPEGWALPTTLDETVLNRLKEKYPGWRTLTEDDVLLLLHSNGTSSSKTIEKSLLADPKPSPPARKPTLAGTRLMNSKDHFLRVLEEAGGWQNAIFVAFDMEAASVGSGGRAYPLELSFIPFTFAADTTEFAAMPPDATEDNVRNEYHCFLYPGPVESAAVSSTYFNTLNTHGIPTGASFLRDDYDAIRRDIDFYVQNKSCILLSKGGTSPALGDAQAIRFVYAAAAWETQDESLKVPTVEDLRIFNHLVVLNTLAETLHRPEEAVPLLEPESDDDRAEPHESSEGSSRLSHPCSQRCWYHSRLQEQMATLESDSYHCARQDAFVLALQINTKIAELINTTA